jgi:cell division protein ZapE
MAAEGAANILEQRYASAAAAGGFTPDPAQLAALQHLERLRNELIRAERRSMAARLMTRFSGLPGHGAAVRGVYLWGSVGRGKTWLMDLFFDSLPFTLKRRSHFHRFMQSVHEGLAAHRDEADPLAGVASDIAAGARVICFDELFVSDIADAMLLGTLFSHLIDRGVSLVFTSNVPPAGLYRDGLQRQRFLPAIALLEKHTENVCVDGSLDYRLRQLTQAPIYLQAATAHASQALREIFEDLADGPGDADGRIDLAGRPVAVVRESENVVWFRFESICEGPRGKDDYVEIAREYQSVIVSDVPEFTASREDAARRFIAMVDEFYDRRVKLILSAVAAPSQLYRGEKLRFEFERTASRLIEMQTEEYLATQHRP